jgi:hypothetical protein
VYCPGVAARQLFAAMARRMAGMNRPPQFSLRYLLIEVFWFTAAFGCATQAIRLPESLDSDLLQTVLMAVSGLFAGAAIWGLVGRMAFGFWAAFWTIVAGVALLIMF